MSTKKLKKIIKNNWGVPYKQLPKDVPLITLTEDVACKSENITVEEAYKMFIGNENLHLPGLIAFYIIDEMGINPSNVNASMTLRELFDL